MKTFLVAVLALVSGCAAAEGADSEAPAPASQVSTTQTAQCVDHTADVVYRGEARADVAYAVLATIHHPDGSSEWQRPAFEEVGVGTRAAVYCFGGSYAVFTRLVSQ